MVDGLISNIPPKDGKSNRHDDSGVTAEGFRIMPNPIKCPQNNLVLP
jgi:hypothetical protein